jgi:hypothetical protein
MHEPSPEKDDQSSDPEAAQADDSLPQRPALNDEDDEAEDEAVLQASARSE